MENTKSLDYASIEEVIDDIPDVKAGEIVFARIDQQVCAEVRYYKSKEDMRQQLVEYHSIDYTGETPLEDFTFEEILEYGEWDWEKVLVLNNVKRIV